MRSFEEYMKHIVGLLENKPPYFLFIFVASVLVVVSIIREQHFRETWALFWYAAAGMVWRYAEKDIRSIRKENKDEKEGIRVEIQHRVIYHVGNFALLYCLVRYLGFI